MTFKKTTYLLAVVKKPENEYSRFKGAESWQTECS